MDVIVSIVLSSIHVIIVIDLEMKWLDSSYSISWDASYWFSLFVPNLVGYFSTYNYNF